MPNRTRRIFSLLMAFHRAFGERMRRMEASDLRSVLRMATLFYVKTASPSMKALAGHLAIRPPSATALVQSMEKAGLLKRMPDEKDRRSVRLALTPKGRAILERQMKGLEGHLSDMLRPLSDRDQEAFIGILEKIT